MFEKSAKVGRPSLNPRTVALVWLLKSGGRWRDLPARYGERLFGQERPSNRGVARRQEYINERMQLLKVILTGGHIHDSEAAGALLQGIKIKGKKILADKAYSCEQSRVFIAEDDLVLCRHQQLKENLRIAMRFDKLSNRFMAFVLFASILIRLK